MKTTISVRIGYDETDQMGFAHHSNYIKYCERARSEFFRDCGLSYGEIEKSGFILPVISIKFNFHKPAKFEDELTVTAELLKIEGVRLVFGFSIENANKGLISDAEIILAFAKKSTEKPCRPPEYIIDKISDNNAKT